MLMLGHHLQHCLIAAITITITITTIPPPTCASSQPRYHNCHLYQHTNIASLHHCHLQFYLWAPFFLLTLNLLFTMLLPSLLLYQCCQAQPLFQLPPPPRLLYYYFDNSKVPLSIPKNSVYSANLSFITLLTYCNVSKVFSCAILSCF